ncbi:5'-methylthioadenosine/S-adenosylhomocysteine nucleosidase [Glycomyces sp. NRRL B-16210]|uniref:5'-methylthioadenosine/S-adenosylhomocysteine nucleosidase family protein n=1 Tax=Glycomyces sp. NRRL B-16210 TaxID=1463821 RepID=UPI0009DE4F42|nr:5'-methylthioadenosine/S-adenosylhomocysteine nucleosidase [Glycomyces sp. NRRL B-16210]
MSDKRTVVILTALNTEYMEVRQHLRSIERHRHKAGTLFEAGSVDDSICRIALCLTGVGNAPAAVVAERAIQEFSPVAVLFVGVAGGLGNAVELGDVVVASHVYAYHGGTSEDDGLRARPRTWETAHQLLQLAQEVDRSDTWRHRLPPETSPPKVHFRPIAAGEIVQNSRISNEALWIRDHYNDAAAIEMEAAGVAQASHLNGAPAAIIRGISDRADGGKTSANDANWQPRAAANAAAFAVELAAALISDTALAAPSTDQAEEHPVNPIEALAVEGGNELVKALAAGLLASLKKIPKLWRRSGKGDEARISEKLHHSAAELAAGDEATRDRVTEDWRTELRHLLEEHPEAQHELRKVLIALQQLTPSQPPIQQHNIANGQGTITQGVIGGSIYNYGLPSQDTADGGRRS